MIKQERSPWPLETLGARQALAMGRRGKGVTVAEELLYSVGRESTVISPDRRRVITFDRAGRLFSYYRHGRTYRRDLAGGLHVRTGNGAVRHWQPLTPEDGEALLNEVHTLTRQVRQQAPARLQQRLDQEVLPWTPAALRAEARRYQAAYQWPPSILPPDCYMSIVLQASTGCSWNKCAFCGLYRDRPFQVRTPEQFAQHAERVRELLGAAWRYRRGIFLADGNALSLSLDRLEPLVHIARQTFPDHQFYGFIDVYSGQRGEPEKWAALARLGFRRVYIGMETGLDELLALLNKPGSRRELASFVAMLKAGGLAVGLIVMVGAGGRPYARRHAQATVEALAAMDLGRDDIIYVSPFLEQPNTEYPQLRRQHQLTPLTPAETEAELQSLTRQIRALGLRTARYDLRSFIY